MATEFKILRGNSTSLFDENGNCKLTPDKLVNGYWYLTNDTAEVFVCLEIDGQLKLQKINDCSDSDWDEVRIENIEKRLSTLEEQDPDVLTLTSRAAFPLVGRPNVLYVDTEKQQSYVWLETDYVPVVGGSDYVEPDIIYGGSAD